MFDKYFVWSCVCEYSIRDTRSFSIPSLVRAVNFNWIDTLDS